MRYYSHKNPILYSIIKTVLNKLSMVIKVKLTWAPLVRMANGNIVIQIIIGIVLAVIIASISSKVAISISFLGTVFVSALKAVAPILVFILVTSALANHKQGTKTNIKPIIILYLVATVFAAITAVLVSYFFPIELVLNVTNAKVDSPEGVTEIFNNLLLNIVDNPVHALATANFLGILAWAVALGIILKYASQSTKNVLNDLSSAVTKIVHIIIRFAPLGIFGLVAGTFAKTGFIALLSYSQLLVLLLSCMLIVALVVNPAIVYYTLRSNPYSLVFQCLRESGVTAFFTRSSAANIPVNMELCKKLNLHEDTYSVSIPLGATINMGGAAVTISVLTLAAVHTMGIKFNIPSAILLSIVAAISACGASGVAGGSLLLIPLGCSLFGVSNDVAMQVVAVGFIIGVVQDSAETALNSSTDVLFTAAVCLSQHTSESAV